MEADHDCMAYRRCPRSSSYLPRSEVQLSLAAPLYPPPQKAQLSHLIDANKHLITDRESQTSQVAHRLSPVCP